MLINIVKKFLKKKIDSIICNSCNENKDIAEISDILFEGIMNIKRESVANAQIKEIIEIKMIYRYKHCKASFYPVNEECYNEDNKHGLYNNIRKIVLLCYKRKILISFLKYFTEEVIPEFISYGDINDMSFTIFQEYE